jgi:ferritin-like metal-binding protein YciE
MSTPMANDKCVKDAMANAAAAIELRFEEIGNMCETIITEEQDMANWLEQQILSAVDS